MQRNVTYNSSTPDAAQDTWSAVHGVTTTVFSPGCGRVEARFLALPAAAFMYIGPLVLCKKVFHSVRGELGVMSVGHVGGLTRISPPVFDTVCAICA